VQRQVQPGRNAQRRDDRGRARHVILHPPHLFARLERDAARIEGHALADQDDRRQVRAARVVLQDDELRLLLRFLRDGHENAHAERLAFGPAQYLRLESGLLGQGCSLRGYLPWGHVVGRGVDQVARQADARSDGLPAAHARFNGRHMGCVAHQHVQSARVRLPVLRRLRPIPSEAVQAEQRPFDSGLRGGLRVQSADARAVDDGRHGLRAQVARLAGRDSRRVTHACQVELVRLAQPHHEHATGRHLPARVEHDRLTRLAGEIACRDDLPDRAVQRSIRRAGRAPGHGDTLEQIDDDHIRGLPGEVRLFDHNLH